MRRLLSLAPAPVLAPTDLPVGVSASLAMLHEGEYGGLVHAGDYSAAQIVADHHDPTADDLASGPPQLVAYTAAPELVNAEQVKKALSKSYPSYMQDNGLGGRVTLWFLIDQTGKVRRWLLKQSSGYNALDRAALKVASLMHFRPAVNFDRPVAVWVALPVVFRVIES